MKRLVLTLTTALALGSPVLAETTAKENFSYSAPSGAFGDGTFKWQMFRFMAEDRERVLALRARQDPAATGSIQGSAATNWSVSRPSEAGRRRAQ
ncbi:MAG: hypothetical protein ACJ8A0_20835 [Microvirga sp.]